MSLLLLSRTRRAQTNETYEERLLDAAVVGDILALRLVSVDSAIDLRDDVLAVLIDDAGLAFVEVVDRRWRPPQHAIAVLVELSTAVVEAVRDFVTDDTADA